VIVPLERDDTVVVVVQCLHDIQIGGFQQGINDLPVEPNFGFFVGVQYEQNNIEVPVGNLCIKHLVGRWWFVARRDVNWLGAPNVVHIEKPLQLCNIARSACVKYIL
jgi:hypothetical protein